MHKEQTQCLLLADFSAKPLKGYLENGAEPGWEVSEAPFDQVMQILLDEKNECWKPQAQFAVIWTRPERVSPAFGRALLGHSVSEGEVIEEVETFLTMVDGAQQRVSNCLLPAWVLTMPRRGLGIRDLKPEGGVGYLLAAMNLHLIRRYAGSRNTYVLDSARWLQEAGKWAYSAKGWYLGKVPFGSLVFESAAKEVRAGVRALQGKAKKLVVVDLDDTLWGGTLGDVGWQNLLVGGHDGSGEAFADLQRELKALRQRGILLAIASKNQEAVALEAIEHHPEMILRLQDFVAWRINWKDKATNISQLVAELNLGLDCVVFLDDSAIERNRVREALPEVLVPELPVDPMLSASVLRSLDCFDVSVMTETDRFRTELYQSKRERECLRALTQTLEEWLEKLETRIIIEPLSDTNWERALQLLNKTNQMNLRTRRLLDSQWRDLVAAPENHFWTVRVSDRFGDSGLVGVLSLAINGKSGTITDFLLSCRVMGRKIEEAMLNYLLGKAFEQGVLVVEAECLQTAKNKPCLEWFQRVSGIEGSRFEFTTQLPSASEKFVQIEVSESGKSD